jgi:hypothetical protein
MEVFLVFGEAMGGAPAWRPLFDVLYCHALLLPEVLPRRTAVVRWLDRHVALEVRRCRLLSPA